MNRKKQLSITVAIPTCYGGPSLVETVKTIFASRGVANIRCIIVADRTPLTPAVKKSLKQLGAEVYWNRKEGSQFKKLKQLITKTQSDIFVFTQDDITFDPNAIAEIEKAFRENPTATIVSSRILPLAPQNIFESSMASMVRLVDKIATYWNNGENYLAASGRCISFRTSLLKKYRIPEQVVNGDMFLYLENKRLGGTFMRSEKSIVYIRCPQKLKDQMGPSSRYQYSMKELTNYFSFPIQKEYAIPLIAELRAVTSEFLSHPFSFSLYVFIFAYTRFKKQSLAIVANPVWAVDISTKNSIF